MIQLIYDGLAGDGNIGKIHYPAGVWIGLPPHMNFNSERMPMQLGTLMSVRDIGQAMCRVKFEHFIYFHFYSLSHPQYFMQLKTDPPLRMGKTVMQRQPGV